MITQELNQAGAQPQQSQESGAQTQAPEKAPEQSAQQVTVDAFGQKYVQLLETQLSEKDATIKDLRETNKFLSITNGKLNEHLRFLLEKPQNPPGP